MRMEQMKATENGANTRGGNESNFFLGRKRVFFFFLKSFFYKFPPQKEKQSVMGQREASGRKDNTRGSEKMAENDRGKFVDWPDNV